MNQSIGNLRTLVLNADMQPLSWAPLSVWSWEDAFVAVHQERVIQVKTYDDVFVRSASRSYEIPAVVALNGSASARRWRLPATMCFCATNSPASTAVSVSRRKT